LVYCAPHLLEELGPGSAGWYSITDSFAPDRFERFALREGAARFTNGMPNFPAIYVMRESLAFLIQLGIGQIDLALKPAVKQLREGIRSLGFELLTPPDELYASGIVSVACDAPEELGRALQDRGVIVWAGDGRLRASVHIYNDEDDVKAFLAALGGLNR
jgi:selenocysteine lyase/cysteine desulfurase